MSAAMRLQKFLSAAGVCSRRRGETYILAGRVRVNGQVVTELGTRINPGRDVVEFDGRLVSMAAGLVYIALNKPKGYVTSCRQPGDRIVLDLVDVAQRIYPIGRLDRDSTGLLLLTNDGRLHHRLSHPSFDHEKEYLVTVARPIAGEALERMAQGVPILGAVSRPAQVERLSPRRFRIVLKEGRNRQIRRMAGSVGHQVLALKRVRVGPVKLGRLAEGRWRHLSPSERRRLLDSLP